MLTTKKSCFENYAAGPPICFASGRLARNNPIGMNVQMAKNSSDVFVVSVDLVGYSLKVKEVEQSTGEAAGTADINSRIRTLVRDATGLSGEALESSFIAETGDGAILKFAYVDPAIDFSARLHSAVREENLKVSVRLAQWDFRVGIAFGAVETRVNTNGTLLFGGLAISNAVRFQSGTKPASTMIDDKSFSMLNPARKAGWLEKRIVTKHGEVLRGYVREAYHVETPSGTVPRAAVPPKDRAALVQRLEALVPHSRLDRLMRILNMPLEMQPSPNQTHQQRVVVFVQWLESPSGPGLDSLEERWLF